LSSLIYKDRVLATGNIAEDAESFSIPDETVFLKSSFPGAFLVSEQPSGSSAFGWDYVEGQFVPTPAPFNKHAAELAAEVRTQRNAKLAACDWTQLPDAASRCDQAAWAAYRQQLCDITQQFGFPKNVAWPTNPNGVI
jgi:hypothetical protein